MGQIWDLASGTLKLTLTGHISAVRGLAVSPRHPYLFSAAEDKMVKCTYLTGGGVLWGCRRRWYGGVGELQLADRAAAQAGTWNTTRSSATTTAT